MQMTTLPTCPPWPWTWEQDRLDAVSARDELLRDAHEETLHAFLEKVWGPKKRAVVGLLDTSWNPLRTWAQQMSTPGLYSVRPTTRGPEGTEGLVGERGLLDRAHWAPVMQHVEYLTRGMGDMFVRPVHRAGKIGLVQVKPWAVHVETDPCDPGRAVELWERCLYRDLERKAWAWVWEVWDISDPDRPSWRVLDARARDRDNLPLPVANLYYPDVPPEGLSGDAYTWRYQTGEPHIPHVHYRSRILPGYWSWETMRGLHRGTFQCARLSNGLLYAADMASHRAVLLMNCAPVGSETVNAGTAGALQTQEILPGTMVPMQLLQPDQPAQIQEVGPGMDVVGQWSVVRSYTLSMLASHGLRESDVVRAEANPTSAAALIISDASRREAQRQLAPLFEESDRELVRKIAALARVHGLGDYPDEDVYTVSYSMIERTSDELQTQRDEEEHELKHGLLSRVEHYMRRRGVDRETAIRELRRVREDERELEAMPSATEPGVELTTSEATEPEATDQAEAVVPVPGAGAAPVADAALNGAQVSALIEILQNLSSGLLTTDGAAALIQTAIPTIPEARVRELVAGVRPAAQVAPAPGA